jgi:hypothetical protein
MTTARKASPTRLCKLARELRDYLAIDVDPHDFADDYTLEMWNAFAESHDWPFFVVDPKDGTPPAGHGAKAFESYLQGNIIPYRMQHDPLGLPAYLHFDNPKLLPKGSWLVHFSRAGFSSIDRGATMDSLALSTWVQKKAVLKSCKQNLRSDIGLFEVVWGFAINAERSRDFSQAAKGYGDHVLLFQTDCAVEAWHTGDEHWQSIFPLCSEYNVKSGSYSGGKFYFEGRENEDLDFDSIDDAIDAALAGKIPN